MPQPHYLSKFKSFTPYLPFTKLCLLKELCTFKKTYDNPSHPLKFSKVASNVLSYTGFKTETER